MLLKYYIKGIPHLESINHMYYDAENSCAYFYADDAMIMYYDVTQEKWNIMTNDMFEDNKLALPNVAGVVRILK